jgi:hypothetical protein
MRALLAVCLGLFGLTWAACASIDLSGTWVLDLKTSDSTEALMKRLGIPAVQRRLAASIKPGASCQ